MRAANQSALLSASPRDDTSDVRSRQTCRQFPSVMARLSHWWANKTAYKIAAHTGYSLRTVQRWMAGEVTPDADVGFALIRSDRGPNIIEIIAADMTPAERIRFWREMRKVAKRQELIAERDRIEKELAET